MDDASKVLENIPASEPWILVGYQKFSPNRPLVDEVIDQNPSPFNPTLSECESHESIPYHPLVEKMVDLILLSVDHIHPVESEVQTAHVLLVSSNSKELGGDIPIPTT